MSGYKQRIIEMMQAKRTGGKVFSGIEDYFDETMVSDLELVVIHYDAEAYLYDAQYYFSKYDTFVLYDKRLDKLEIPAKATCAYTSADLVVSMQARLAALHHAILDVPPIGWLVRKAVEIGRRFDR